jgi:hypothetical protein
VASIEKAAGLQSYHHGSNIVNTCPVKSA